MIKNPPASTRDIRDVGSIPGLGRSPEEGHAHPLQCSCLENPMDRGTWRAVVHRVESDCQELDTTELLSMQAHLATSSWPLRPWRAGSVPDPSSLLASCQPSAWH